MRINSTNYYCYNNISLSQPTFASVKARKLIQKVEQAERLNRVEITFDELERMYEEIGYYVFKKRGSHANVTLNDNITIAIIIPHGKKYVNTNDLKRFLLVKQGKFLEASKVH